jgi:hypothetical protein
MWHDDMAGWQAAAQHGIMSIAGPVEAVTPPETGPDVAPQSGDRYGRTVIP